MRRVISWVGLVSCAAVVGCGPMSRPIPERLKEDDQKRLDQAWDTALTPVGKHDRQTLLDVMVGTQAYQVGVDQLQFRSVKKWSGGTVVMEIHFDREKPVEDRFTITVNDLAGKPLRAERYSRDDVEQAVKDLAQPPVPDNDPAMQAHKARMKKIEAVLPKPKGEPDK